ncbi:MAG: ABC transporter ATP-binding protein, partial [Deltaproteobacteria bacterium]
MARITLKNLVKQFGKVIAVAGINLEIADGEFLILVGPSGCGKTTTLNMISGLETPTSGEVCIDDRVVNDLDPGERDLGMVFQDLALFPHMSVFENIAFGLRVKKMPEEEIRKRVLAAAETMLITKLLDKRPSQCSGGEAQRVALARTVVRNPAVFLMDEPLSSLDAKLRVDMRTEIKHLHEQIKATFVYVTHDQAEAMTMADRIVVMRDGHIQQSGGPLDIYGRPTNQFVAGFFGTPTMNFIEGALEESGAGLVFRARNLEQLLPAETRLKDAGTVATIGIRSEHVLIGEGSNQGRVILTEPLGSETLVFFEYGGDSPLVAKVSPEQSFTPGDSIRFGFAGAGI